MASKTEEINIKVKSDIGEVSKDASSLAGEFQVMGVSLNSLKAGFASMAKTAKASFATVKAGLISTGIGAFAVLLGSLVAWFTKTKKGAELLQRGLAGLGAVVNVLTDAFAELGGIIIDTFQDPLPSLKKFGEGLLKFLKDPTGATRDMFIKATLTFKEFKEEIVEETAAMIALKKASQELADSQRDLNVETAESVADIEKLKLVAEDITKSYKEREEAANSAFAKETELENKRIELAEEAVRIEQERHGLMGKDGVMAEDLDALAELEINLANIRQESAGRQISLQNFLNGLRETEKAQKDADKAEADADKLAAEETAKTEADFLLALQQENTLALISDLKERALAELKIQEDKELASAELMGNSEEVKAEIEKKFTRKRGEIGKKEAEEQVKWSEMTSDQQLSIASDTAGNLSKILGEQTAAGKAMAITQATIDTFKGAQAAYASLAGIPVVGPVLGGIAAAAAIAAGIANVKAITSADASGPSGGGGGGGGSISAGAVAQAPAPQMMQGAFELGDGQAPEPVQAYVVTDDMTQSQNKLQNIRRRATI